MVHLWAKIDALFTSDENAPKLTNTKQQLLLTVLSRACNVLLSHLTCTQPQVRIKNRAYAFLSDVIEALDEALFVLAPQHFKFGVCVFADTISGKIQCSFNRT